MGFESNIAGQTKLDFGSASSAAQRLVMLDLAEVDTIDAAGLGNFIFLNSRVEIHLLSSTPPDIGAAHEAPPLPPDSMHTETLEP